MSVATRIVLVLDPGDGHGRSALATVRALGAAGYKPVVGTWGRASLAAASRASTRTIHLPDPSDPRFAAVVSSVNDELGVLNIFPTSDAALRALDSPGNELVDKSTLAQRAAAVGFPTPPTQRFESGAALLDASATLHYPVVIKPVFPTRPAKRFGSPRALIELAGITEPVLVQPFMSEPMRAVGGVIRDGRLIAASHQRILRTWPAECGTSSAAETIDPDEALERALIELLAGFDGVFQAQLAGPYLLDLNPRAYGSLPLAVVAGANLPAVWCDLQRGLDVTPHRARPGVRYRWIEGDLRSVWAGLRSGRIHAAEALRALAPKRGTAHSTESLSDPRPTLVRIRHTARRG